MTRPSGVSEFRDYFWPYDVFGYLLPGCMLAAAYILTNSRLRDGIVRLFPAATALGLALALALGYVLGHILAALSSWMLERLILKRAMKYPAARLFNDTPTVGWLREVLFPGYFRPYSVAFQQEFETRFRSVFPGELYDEHDRFWLAWSFVCLHHPVAYRRASHFLDLYGFSRNVSMGLLLVGAAPFWPGWDGPLAPPFWVATFALLSWMMFVNYAKLLRRLSDEVFRAFVATTATLAPSASARPVDKVLSLTHVGVASPAGEMPADHEGPE